MSYRVVYIYADGSLSTEAAGIGSIDGARHTASTLMPPKGYLRPVSVEIEAGSSVVTAGVMEWRGNGGRVDDGQVNDAGRILWRAAESRRGPKTVAQAEAFDLDAAAEAAATAQPVELPADQADEWTPAPPVLRAVPDLDDHTPTEGTDPEFGAPGFLFDPGPSGAPQVRWNTPTGERPVPAPHTAHGSAVAEPLALFPPEATS